MAADMIAVRGRVEGEADRKIFLSVAPSQDSPVEGQAALDRHPDPVQKARWLAELTEPRTGSPRFEGEKLETLSQIFKARRTEKIGKELLGFARDLETSDQGLAGILYDFLQSKKEFSKHTDQARNRFEIMQGGGSGAEQAAAFGGNFLHHLLDIPSALTMVAGGFGFRLARPAFGSLFCPLFNITGKLTSRQMLGRRLFANTGAWATEATTFAGAGKLMHAAFGREVDWSKESWKNDWLHGAILMGNIRSAFWAGGLAGKAFQRAGWFGRRSAWALQNFSLLTGIRLSQFEEGLVGLSRQNPLMDEDMETLQHFAFFKGAGWLLRHFTPRPIQRWERELDLDGELTLESLAAALPKFDLKNQLRSFANKLLTQHSPLMTQTVAMAAKGQPTDDSVMVTLEWLERFGNANPLPREIITPDDPLPSSNSDYHYQPERLSPYQRVRVQHFIDNAPKTTLEAVRTIEAELQSNYGLMRIIDQGEFSDLAKLDFALQRLDHMVERNNPEGTRGTYAGWITRLALRRIISHGNAPRLKQLVDLLHEGCPIKIYEIFLAPDLPPSELAPSPRFIDNIIKKFNPVFQGINHLALSNQAKTVLWRFYLTQQRADKAKAEDSARALIHRITGALGEPYMREAAEQALEFAGESPLALLRLKRLFQILGREEMLTNTKLYEIADSHFQIHGKKPPPLPPNPVEIVGTQWDAYLGKDYTRPEIPSVFARKPNELNQQEMELRTRTELICLLHQRAPDLLDPVKAEQRAGARTEALKKYLEGLQGRDPFTRKGIEGAFRALGDKVSLEIANRIRENKYELKLEEEEAYYQAIEDFTPGEKMDPETRQKNRDFGNDGAYYMPKGPGRAQGTMLILKPSLQMYSKEIQPDVLFHILWRIAHEDQHDRDISPHEIRYCTVHHRQETSAKAKDALFYAIHGYTGPLQSYLSTAPEGLGLRFRDFFEREYGFIFEVAKGGKSE